MEFLEPNFLCIYGGRNNEELNGANRRDGVYNDIYLFNIDVKQWIVPHTNQLLEYRYGASCCTSKNKLIIFGGNNTR
jgi:N-acetylneuraminic acid mutarotase